MAIFIVLVVSLVAGQTCLDWRQTQRESPLPAWARGVALGGLLAVGLTAATAFTSVAYEAALAGWNPRLTSNPFWLEAVFVAVAMGVLVGALRKKRLIVVFALAGLLAATVAFSLAFLT